MSFLTARLSWAIVFALVLTILPLPPWLANIRPPWILLLVLFLQFFLADFFNIIILLILGLIVDILLSTVMGEHVFALTFIAWLVNTKAKRFCFFNISQQMLLIGFFCLLYQYLLSLLDLFLGYPIDYVHIIGSAFIGLLIWPWIVRFGALYTRIEIMVK